MRGSRLHEARVPRPSWQGKLCVGKRSGQRLRAAVHARDNFTCQICSYRPTDAQIPVDYAGAYAIGTWRIPAERELQVDHIFPRSLGGDAVLENLQTLCQPCNVAKWTRV